MTAVGSAAPKAFGFGEMLGAKTCWDLSLNSRPDKLTVGLAQEQVGQTSSTTQRIQLPFSRGTWGTQGKTEVGAASEKQGWERSSGEEEDEEERKEVEEEEEEDGQDGVGAGRGRGKEEEGREAGGGAGRAAGPHSASPNSIPASAAGSRWKDNFTPGTLLCLTAAGPEAAGEGKPSLRPRVPQVTLGHRGDLVPPGPLPLS